MKRLTQILLPILILLALFVPPMVMAETLPTGVTEAGSAELLTKELLGTQLGMILVANTLTQLIKRIFMRKAGIEAVRTMAFIVSLAVVVLAKVIMGNIFEVADILIVPGNAYIIWLSAMKNYEISLGTAATPAGNTHANIN